MRRSCQFNPCKRGNSFDCVGCLDTQSRHVKRGVKSKFKVCSERKRQRKTNTYNKMDIGNGECVNMVKETETRPKIIEQTKADTNGSSIQRENFAP